MFYRDTLGLAIYREFGSGPDRGIVFFLGGGFLELSGRAAAPPAPGMALWLQCGSWPGCDGSSVSVACRSCGSQSGSRGGCWRCGSPTRMGCASASWRCRRSIRCAAATEAAPPSPRFSPTAAAGAGRWMRSSLALGRARSGCGTRKAASGWCAAPTPPIRPRRGWWRSRRTPEAEPPRTLAGSTPHETSPRWRLGAAAAASVRQGPPLAMDPALERSGRGAATAQQVTWSMAMTAPSAWFQTAITSGVGSSSTWQRWRSK